VKHFAAYGGAEGGRDYNTVDISERTLREVYLPPFEAAVKAGVGTVMCSFNEIAGIPSSANEHLLREILRREWGFKGFVVSDWGSIPEMQEHGFASSSEEAAYLALRAGVDMDMEGGAYEAHLVGLVRAGRLPEETLDSAVRHVLRVKFALGLFDDPHHGASADRERRAILAPSHRALAREVAGESLVLLKNAGGLLPLRKDLQSIAVIGPLADDRESILGPWSAAGRSSDAVSVLAGIRRKVAASTKILYARGCAVVDTSTSSFSGALSAAAGADAVVMVMGEESGMSGEAASRSTLGLPGAQQQLFEAVLRLHRPLVVVLMNGRPLAIGRLHEFAPAILEAWFPGVEGGNAVADVLFGDRDPSGKITATFPFSVGQVPLYYNHKSTGRPARDDTKWTSKYIDGPTTPLYPFGYGLHYTSFAYESLKLGATRIRRSDSLSVSVELHNAGERAGEETVQLYIRDVSASVTHPVKELKAFRKVRVEPGRTEKVEFQLTPESLALYDRGMRKVVEPGQFEVMVGGNSRDLLTATLDVTAE
jgi:beta-glucosidase